MISLEILNGKFNPIEILNGKLHFLGSVSYNTKTYVWNKSGHFLGFRSRIRI